MEVGSSIGEVRLPAAGAPLGSAAGDGYQIDAWLDWLRSVGFSARNHIILTFEGDEFWDVRPERAAGMFSKLVKELNVAMCEKMGGKGAHYKRWWRHSYFSYLMCLERQKRGTLHIHAVTDNWVDYSLIHRLWGHWCGFAWVRGVTPGDEVATRYVLKYVTKVNAPGAVWLRRKRVEVPAYQVVKTVKVNEVCQAYLNEVVCGLQGESIQGRSSGSGWLAT